MDDDNRDDNVIDYNELFNKQYVSPPLNVGFKPKVYHEIALASPYVSQVSQMQLLQNKYNQLRDQKKIEHDFINQYLQGDYTKFLKYPHLPSSIIKPKPPTQREQLINQILRLRGFNSDGSSKVSPNQFQAQGQVQETNATKVAQTKAEAEAEGKKSERIETPKSEFNKKEVIELQNELFQIRNNMSNIRTSIMDIKNSFHNKIREYELKQNRLIENVRRTIILGGSNQLKEAADMIYDRKEIGLKDIKEELPKYYIESVELINNKLKENEENRKKTFNQSNPLGTKRRKRKSLTFPPINAQ